MGKHSKCVGTFPTDTQLGKAGKPFKNQQENNLFLVGKPLKGFTAFPVKPKRKDLPHKNAAGAARNPPRGGGHL